MPSRRTSQDQLAEVARRRLELLSAELAEIRTEQPHSRDRLTEVIEERADPGPPPPALAGTAAGRHAHRSVGLGGRLSGWVRDRLPATLQGGAALSVAHLAVVVCALVAAVLATVWWVSRNDDGGRGSALPVAAPSALVSVSPTDPGTSAPPAPASTVPGGAASAAGPGAAPSGTVVVDVAGKVRRPGIATLPLGARVVDALEAAGGARRGVRLGSLNLARVLTDGEQVVVGVPAPPGVAASAAPAPTGSASGAGGGSMVNINTAGQTELEELPGIGPVTAQAILTFRSERGTFSSVDELLEVSGIGEATLADMAPYVTL